MPLGASTAGGGVAPSRDMTSGGNLRGHRAHRRGARAARGARPSRPHRRARRARACPRATVAPSFRMCSFEMPLSSAAIPAPPARPTMAPATGTASARPEQEADRPAADDAFPGRELTGLLKLDAAVVSLDHDRRVVNHKRVLVAQTANDPERGVGQLRGVVGDGDRDSRSPPTPRTHSADDRSRRDIPRHRPPSRSPPLHPIRAMIAKPSGCCFAQDRNDD